MSRHLLIRCDAPGCTQQTETSARDDEPTSIAVPSGWLTLIAPERHHRHYCSEACVGAAFTPKAPPVASQPDQLPAGLYMIESGDPAAAGALTVLTPPVPEVSPSAARAAARKRS